MVFSRNPAFDEGNWTDKQWAQRAAVNPLEGLECSGLLPAVSYSYTQLDCKPTRLL